VGTTEPEQQALIRGELLGFVAHISWRPGEGWRVHATSWDVGQRPSDASVERYEHLMLSEALDVLSAVAYARCEWVQDPLPT
jgi:hypothetical protein